MGSDERKKEWKQLRSVAFKPFSFSGASDKKDDDLLRKQVFSFKPTE